MATRAELDRLGEARRRVVELVQQQLNAFFMALPMSNPEQMRNALLEFMPLMVNQFGEVAEQVALEWYEGVRANGYQARPGPNPVPRAAIEAKVRYQAGHLFTDNPMEALAGLSSAVGKYVSQYSRSAITYNAGQEGIRYIRVPRGEKTCAFCYMLASRGAETLGGVWLYRSKESAGDTGNPDDDYHTKCDCEAVPMADDDDVPAGHDIDEMYANYKSAWWAAGGRGARGEEVAYEMRRMFPDMLTDGVHVHAD